MKLGFAVLTLAVLGWADVAFAQAAAPPPPFQAGPENGQPAPVVRGWAPSAPAAAITPQPKPAEPELVPGRSYWWQTLGLDLLNLAIASRTESAPGLVAGYFVAAPLVHALHDEPASMLGSLALRALFPAATIGLFLAAESGRDEDNADHGSQAVGAGALVGGLAAVIVDAAWLARESPQRVAPRRAASAPLLQVSSHGGYAGWQGTF